MFYANVLQAAVHHSSTENNIISVFKFNYLIEHVFKTQSLALYFNHEYINLCDIHKHNSL